MTNDIQFWWHGIAALPATRCEHAYYALRRVWGDHTIAGGRSFYRIGSEDHVTPALFQNFSLFPHTTWVTELVHAIGGSAGIVKKVRWAYACEEILPAHRRRFHGRDFVIPDIMLQFEDEHGSGLVAFEVKKPGKAAEAVDEIKLDSYVDLNSASSIRRRYGCLLVSDQMAEKSSQVCNKKWPAFTWERLGKIQIDSASSLSGRSEAIDLVAAWIAWNFNYFGIDSRTADRPPPASGVKYGDAEGYRTLLALSLPDSVKRFLQGSECIEAIRRDETPCTPLEWLKHEPSVTTIRQLKQQTTSDRRVCRWNYQWSATRERTWR